MAGPRSCRNSNAVLLNDECDVKRCKYFVWSAALHRDGANSLRLYRGSEQLLERVAGDHLPLEDAAEVARGGVDRVLHGGLARGVVGGLRFELERGDSAVGDAAGDDRSKSRRSVVTLRAKPCEVTPCETWMPRAAIFFSCILPRAIGPDASALAMRCAMNAEVVADADDDLFEQAHEVDRAEVRALFAGPVAAQVDDGVADELAGAVVGDVAAAVDLVQLDVAARREVRRWRGRSRGASCGRG